MKASRYNIFSTISENNILGFNGISLGWLKLNKSEYDYYELIKSRKIGMPFMKKKRNVLKNSLLQGKFIIENNFDELSYINLMFNMNKFRNDVLALTICPTLNCNFKCLYCFECHKDAYMGKDIEEEVIKFIRQRVSNMPGILSLHVTWYGGEPLLAKDTIFRMSEKIIKICKANDLNYSGSIITNGSLLNKRTAMRLKQHRISQAQVTLDGPPEIHDKTRPFMNGSPSFSIIFKNIQEAASIINISLRINLLKTNAMKISPLFNILKSADIMEKIRIHFGRVHITPNTCQDLPESCFSAKEFSKIELKLCEQYKEYMLPFLFSLLYPKSSCSQCTATSLNSFVISPDGSLSKCWETVGQGEEIIGHVSEEIKVNSTLLKWLSFSPTNYKDCANCNILPICMGGCPYKFMEEQKSHRFNCEKWKFGLVSLLKFLYENRIDEPRPNKKQYTRRIK
jgi:uncharacterized protein